MSYPLRDLMICLSCRSTWSKPLASIAWDGCPLCSCIEDEPIAVFEDREMPPRPLYPLAEYAPERLTRGVSWERIWANFAEEDRVEQQEWEAELADRAAQDAAAYGTGE